ncbi:SAM-dependent methyltransferase [Enemella sp. A6]|uniref:SAM-dependent methyltransferase n=1 Tax=Enemella sp. A6 TaxID=3440152 RepID=UPI003EBAC0D7
MVNRFLPDHNPAFLDLGAGSGELTAALTNARPQSPFAGVDLRAGPTDVTWLVDTWDVLRGEWSTGAVEKWWTNRDGPVVVIGHEFLDELPCPIGPDADPEWAAHWWPNADHPHLPENGRTRDLAWADVIRRLRRTGGLAVMVDYGHVLPDRPTDPTLRGFRDGRLVEAVFDGSVNLTADVAVDAVAAAAEAEGAERVWFARQSATVEHWLPEPSTASSPLTDLMARNRRRVLATEEVAGSRGLGAYWWLVHHVRPSSDPTGDMAG